MKKESRAALDAYFAEGDSWAADRNEALRASRRIAWLVALAAAFVAIAEALALLFLAPLKTVVPYTLLVDRQTGFVQALKPLEAQRITGDRALTQSFLVQYVIAREGFDIDSLQSDYRKVALWSAAAARSDYISGIQVSNPGSPIARLPRSTIIEVQVKSVTPLSNNSAMVRYDTIRRDAGSQIRPAQSWVAVIRYTYSGEPMSVEDRMINPLGFKVTRYRRSAEILPQPAPESATDLGPSEPVAAGDNTYAAPASPRTGAPPAAYPRQ